MSVLYHNELVYRLVYDICFTSGPRLWWMQVLLLVCIVAKIINNTKRHHSEKHNEYSTTVSANIANIDSSSKEKKLHLSRCPIANP